MTRVTWLKALLLDMTSIALVLNTTVEVAAFKVSPARVTSPMRVWVPEPRLRVLMATVVTVPPTPRLAVPAAKVPESTARLPSVRSAEGA